MVSHNEDLEHMLDQLISKHRRLQRHAFRGDTSRKDALRATAVNRADVLLLPYVARIAAHSTKRPDERAFKDAVSILAGHADSDSHLATRTRDARRDDGPILTADEVQSSLVTASRKFLDELARTKRNRRAATSESEQGAQRFSWKEKRRIRSAAVRDLKATVAGLALSVMHCETNPTAPVNHTSPIAVAARGALRKP